jgi:hypothetical protein
MKGGAGALVSGMFDEESLEKHADLWATAERDHVSGVTA